MAEADVLAGWYDQLFERQRAQGVSILDGAIVVADAYLDGRPQRKLKITRAERDRAFWASQFLGGLPAEAWCTDAMTHALTRYMSQQRVGALPLLEQLATMAPDVVRQAVRWSGLVLQPGSPRRAEVRRLAELVPDPFAQLVGVLEVLDRAHAQRLEEVERWRAPMESLTPVELIAYASLYAFEHLVPGEDQLSAEEVAALGDCQESWEAIGDLVAWKLATSELSAFKVNDRDIALSLAEHLVPFLLPSSTGHPPRHDLLAAFEALLAAQRELNSFIARFADAFSFDDSVEFILRDGVLDLMERDPAPRAARERENDRLARLYVYWWYRAVEAFAESAMATETIGRPENHEDNRFAWIKALRTRLLLTEVYGLGEHVTTDAGTRVDLFQALLSLEFMAAFFRKAFIQPFLGYLEECGDAHVALGRLAFGGFLEPAMQNRLPLTWSDRATKVAMITGWTVSPSAPRGSARAAEAILDFWTVDWTALSARLRREEPGLTPRLFERPVIRMGRILFQLPWMVATQYTAVTAVNNLRRLGARRPEARAETQRIEETLARLLESRGFEVRLNFQPPVTPQHDPGEVDVICARDGEVLVLEVKSTFIRHTLREARLHGATTLRKAGRQLARKVEAVTLALRPGGELADLRSDSPPDAPHVRGWIVDTSIEHDHCTFNGSLKVSLEEVMIALRDDSHLLDDPSGMCGVTPGSHDDTRPAMDSRTLYPDGFSAARFIEVIESEAVWERRSVGV